MAADWLSWRLRFRELGVRIYATLDARAVRAPLSALMLSAVASLLTAPAPALVTEDACRATSSSDDGGVTVLVLGSERAFD